jgi:hypothetical protein
MLTRDLDDLQRRRRYALAQVVTAARGVVAHVNHNASRDLTTGDYGYITTCALLMRPDAPVGQLIEWLTKLDLIDLGFDQPEEPDDRTA